MDLTENHDENSDKGYIFEVDVEYSKHLHDFHSNLPFLPERIKINKRNKLTKDYLENTDIFSKKKYKSAVVHYRKDPTYLSVHLYAKILRGSKNY